MTNSKRELSISASFTLALQHYIQKDNTTQPTPSIEGLFRPQILTMGTLYF